jgi:hypothetical protein
VDPNVAAGLVDNIKPAAEYDRVDLNEEDAVGGHTIPEHVAKSREYLIRRVENSRIEFGGRQVWEDRVGSFPSLEAAQKLVNSTLSKNKAIVDLVAKGELGVDKPVPVDSFFESPTGYESYAPRFHSIPEIRNTYGVRVVLRHDPFRPRGFTIRSAFPVNSDD